MNFFENACGSSGYRCVSFNFLVLIIKKKYNQTKTYNSDEANLHSANPVKFGMKAARSANEPATADENINTGFRPKESAAQPQKGAVKIMPASRMH